MCGASAAATGSAAPAARPVKPQTNMVTMYRVEPATKTCIQISCTPGAVPAWQQAKFQNGTCAQHGHGNTMFNAKASNVFVHTK